MPRCDECQFFQSLRGAVGNASAWGECRRRRPSPQILSRWPNVNGNDWCGEFASKPLDELDPPKPPQGDWTTASHRFEWGQPSRTLSLNISIADDGTIRKV